MRDLNDALRQGFEAHARELETVGIDTAVGERAMGAARRRRTMRTAGVGVAATVAVGGVAVGAAALGAGSALVAPAAPDIAPTIDCAAWPYIPPNPAAMGDEGFEYRVYSDLRDDAVNPGVVVVRADGTWTRVEPDADGAYVYVYDGRPQDLASDMAPDDSDQPYAWVSDTFGYWGTGGDWDGIEPPLEDYAWTLDIPDEVPVGVDTVSLSSTLRTVFGGGAGYSSAAVPDGAVAQAVITTTEGETVTSLSDGSSMPEPRDLDTLESVALRISDLPEGETFTMTATYDPDGPVRIACADPAGAASVTPAPSPSPAG